MRGSLGRWKDCRGPAGIIPAHAGLTLVNQAGQRHGRDHPRACGAHQVVRIIAVRRPGSSPRMRGSLLIPQIIMILAGIIPAHAGLTDFLDSLFDSQWDHPRACGAHDPVIATIAEVLGSSPRMRGSPWRWYFIVIRLGIIPAHAGLTWESRTTNCSSRDHPRACGAHVLALADFESRWGSSPRMRGSQARTHAEHGAPGIIPAHAGLTDNIAREAAFHRDHPRACGAHLDTTASMRRTSGSSPRMRGSRQLLRVAVIESRIIPAHAGLTAISSLLCHCTRDHPRACGAHLQSGHNHSSDEGSSPRMRGSLSEVMPLIENAGIIPAHAGLTVSDFLSPSTSQDHPRACGAHPDPPNIE